MNDYEKTTSQTGDSLPLAASYDLIDGPGHAWLRVPLVEIDLLKIADKISNYSYMDGQFAYLEEDIDLSVFVRARAGLPEIDQCTEDDDLKARAFCKKHVKSEYHEQPFVRQLRSYRPHKMIRG